MNGLVTLEDWSYVYHVGLKHHPAGHSYAKGHTIYFVMLNVSRFYADVFFSLSFNYKTKYLLFCDSFDQVRISAVIRDFSIVVSKCTVCRVEYGNEQSKLFKLV